ncbi:uncharacterized protein LOC116011003 [Ipomoea triloba]|uniref:uncharacterized protein LOC116011003 n=1 Tax=Ipomoea triloba TaxID=35885 RepID=UPI00125E8816|nr:uncharacterized protein LOC116011003 [Ipomoea triloba]
MIPKEKSLLTTEERTRVNLDNIAKDILYKALDKSLFPRVRKCKNAKDIWDVLMLIGDGDEQEKENKLTIAMKKFEDFKLNPKESITEMEARFIKLLMKINDLDEKKLSQKEINLKILRGLPKSWEMKVVALRGLPKSWEMKVVAMRGLPKSWEMKVVAMRDHRESWEMKVVAMRDHRDLKTMSTTQIFSDLKAYEFEKETQNDEEPETRNIALVANHQPSSSTPRFKRFMRKNQSYDNSDKIRRTKYRSNDKASGSRTHEKDEIQVLCYNCRKPGHFKAECPYPIVKKHQDEHNYKKNSGNYHNLKNAPNDADEEPNKNQKNDRRRKALAVEEKSGDKNDESCTSSSSLESDSSEDEKGLLCLFSQEDSNEELCLMADEEEVTSQNHSSNYSSESTYHENPREAFERMMKSFDGIEDSHFKLKEENAKLLAERQDLEDLRSKNAEMLESISQLEKQVHFLEEEYDQRPSGSRTGLGYSSSSHQHVLLTRPTDPSTSGGLSSVFIQGQTENLEPVINAINGTEPQSTSRSNDPTETRIVDPTRGNSQSGNPRSQQTPRYRPRVPNHHSRVTNGQPLGNNQSKGKFQGNKRQHYSQRQRKGRPQGRPSSYSNSVKNFKKFPSKHNGGDGRLYPSDED